MVRNIQLHGLAALGAMEFSLSVPPDEQRKAGLSVRESLSKAIDKGVVRCLLTPEKMSATPDLNLDLADLEQAWGELVEEEIHSRPRSKGLSLGLELAGPRGTPTLAPALAEDLALALSADEGVESVFFSDGGLPKDGPWHWPLRIGFLDDPASRDLCSVTAGSYAHQDLIEVRSIHPWPKECDLILTPGLPDEGNLEALGGAPAGMLLVIVESSEPLPALARLMRLREQLPRPAIAALRAVQGLGQSFSTLLDELSHNRRLDEALGAAAGSPENLLLIAQPEWLSSASITGFLEQVDLAVEEGRGLGELSPELLRHGGYLLTKMRERIASLGFFSEGGGAREVATHMDQVRRQPMAPPIARPKLSKAKKPTPKMAPPPPPSPGASPAPTAPAAKAAQAVAVPRRLQHQVFEVNRAKRARRRHSFRAGRAHEIRIRIGPGGEDWADSQADFPYESLPPAQKHELEVVLRPQWPGAEAQKAPLTLWPEGPSTVASFAVDIPAEATQVELLVQVLHKGRHLQAGSLRGKVTTKTDASDPASTICFVISPQAQTDLAHQREADITLTCDADEICMTLQGRDVPPRRLPNLQDWVRRVQGILSDAAREVACLESGLANAEGLQHLRNLASRGAFLKGELFRGFGSLPAASRVEVISQCSAESIPIEFLYDFERPDEDAVLCERFLDPGLDRPCPDCAFQNDATRVCPFGFWGLNREIGRQLIDLSRADPGSIRAPEPSGDRPSLPPLKSLQMAASIKVNEDVPGLVEKTYQAIRTRLGDPVRLVDSWEAWRQWIRDSHPCILLLLPHNEDAEAGPCLEIGNKDLRLLDDIDEDCVASPGSGVVPVVLLLGCDTAAAGIGFEDFISQFRTKGAGMVVGTTTKALGRQVAPAAQEFINQLCNPDKVGTTFAELMRLARTKLLREGNLLSLGLVAYGDADWRIA